MGRSEASSGLLLIGPIENPSMAHTKGKELPEARNPAFDQVTIGFNFVFIPGEPISIHTAWYILALYRWRPHYWRLILRNLSPACFALTRANKPHPTVK